MGRLISDRMSYRNHYMCSGEATSVMKIRIINKIYRNTQDILIYLYFYLLIEVFPVGRTKINSLLWRK